MTAVTPKTPAAFPARVRFVNGRTRHRVRPPAEHRWWDLLEAACGKTGCKTDAYVFGEVRDCRGCEAAVRVETEQAA